MVGEEPVYQVALTKVPHIGHVHAKTLAAHFGSATAIFNAGVTALAALDGIGLARAKSITGFNAFDDCKRICEASDRMQAKLLFITDEQYPQQLLNCYDPPTLLYVKGTIDLNQPKMLSVVGTRHHTEYGRQQTESIIGDLRHSSVVIVSGMAYGIDGQAHRAALKFGLPTIGVLAHGLHTIYPPEHRSLAQEILAQGGGFITEFPPGAKPDRFNFPIRNRIVAGIAPALLVIETGKKGGSMITAALAGGYNSQVYALPGRRTDIRSEGCNFLLHNRTASPFYSADAFLADMNWHERKKTTEQITMPFVLDEAESAITNLLGHHGILSIDDLYVLSGLSSGAAAGAILSLEMRKIIRGLPGKRYQRCV